ncbi:MAG: hypothetical protein M1548_04150 [Actinobacteria bacterium]|nr:hypothetical protein [Actinomycetota bacterium]
MPERYDLRAVHYGRDPRLFFEDTFERISGELSPNEEATVLVNPEHFTEPVESMAQLAEAHGLSVVTTQRLATDEALIEVRRKAA